MKKASAALIAAHKLAASSVAAQQLRKAKGVSGFLHKSSRKARKALKSAIGRKVLLR